MKQQPTILIDPELKGADAALRRAAINAKKLAEQQGVPYVIKDSESKAGNNLTNPAKSMCEQ